MGRSHASTAQPLRARATRTHNLAHGRRAHAARLTMLSSTSGLDLTSARGPEAAQAQQVTADKRSGARLPGPHASTAGRVRGPGCGASARVHHQHSRSQGRSAAQRICPGPMPAQQAAAEGPGAARLPRPHASTAGRGRGPGAARLFRRTTSTAGRGRPGAARPRSPARPRSRTPAPRATRSLRARRAHGSSAARSEARKARAGNRIGRLPLCPRVLQSRLLDLAPKSKPTWRCRLGEGLHPAARQSRRQSCGRTPRSARLA